MSDFECRLKFLLCYNLSKVEVYFFTLKNLENRLTNLYQPVDSAFFVRSMNPQKRLKWCYHYRQFLIIDWLIPYFRLIIMMTVPLLHPRKRCHQGEFINCIRVNQKMTKFCRFLWSHDQTVRHTRLPVNVPATQF